MDVNRKKRKQRSRRKTRVRKRVFGTPDMPRLTVFRSLQHVYAQIIDDTAGITRVATSTRDRELRETLSYGGNRTAAQAVGARLAKLAKAQGIAKVAFDRNGYRYHGRLKALADAAREGGLAF